MEWHIYGKIILVSLLLGFGVGAIVYSVTSSIGAANITLVVVLVAAMYMQYLSYFKEGFNTNTPPTEISNLLRNIKDSKTEDSKIEGFNTNTPPNDISNLLTKLKSNNSNQGFLNVTRNIMQGGFGTPGFGMGAPLVEGYEDVKLEKNEKPAPAVKKVEEEEKKSMPQPFTLGEIPSQSKKGPHIDAGSTLIKAIQGLNPDQINAMTTDTKQLIETQKSLMGMLGTMKPMLNDGKQLMETFQEMFGEHS